MTGGLNALPAERETVLTSLRDLFVERTGMSYYMENHGGFERVVSQRMKTLGLAIRSRLRRQRPRAVPGRKRTASSPAPDRRPRSLQRASVSISTCWMAC